MAPYVTTLMQHSEFPSLKEFRLGVRDLRWEEAEQLFHALSQCKACQTLEHVFIALCRQVGYLWDEHEIGERSLNNSFVSRS